MKRSISKAEAVGHVLVMTATMGIGLIFPGLYPVMLVLLILWCLTT